MYHSLDVKLANDNTSEHIDETIQMSQTDKSERQQ